MISAGIVSATATTVRFTETAQEDCCAYHISEDRLADLLANNPRCGTPKPDINQNLYCLSWARTVKAGEAEELVIWYIYVPEKHRVEIIAISEPGDIVSDRLNNAARARKKARS
jgi:plasmid stabilization system protein ParE